MGFGSNFFRGGLVGRKPSGNTQTVDFRLTGDRELLRALKEMGKLSRRSVKMALDAGAGIIKQAVVNNVMAVKDTGLLAKSIKVGHRRYKYPGTLLAVVGPTHMKRMMRRTKTGKLRVVSANKTASWRDKGATLVPYDPGNYGHLVEYGTKPHTIKSKSKKAMKPFGSHPFKTAKGGGPVQHPGTQGIGFMRRAVDASARQALQKVNSKLLEEIKKAAAKHRPRAAT